MKIRLGAIIYIIILCNTYNCYAQLVDSKLSIYSGYQTGLFHGKVQVHKENFIYPALYSNMSGPKGFITKVLYKYKHHFSYGIGIAHCTSSGWEYENNQEYRQAKIEISSIALTIQYHKEFSEQGFFNRFYYFVEFSPIFGMSNFTSASQLFVIQGPSRNISSPTNSKDPFGGFNVNAGVEWAFSQSFSAIFSYSLQHNRISSMLYDDTHFTVSQLNAGIAYKLLKDKRFIYN